MLVLIFSVFDRKYSFQANFDEKIKIVRLSLNLVPRLICNLVARAIFGQILDKFCPKTRNC